MDVEEIFDQLMRIDSQNPDLSPGVAGEAELATAVGSLLGRSGAKVTFQPVVDGRPNVVGVLEGTPGEGAIVLEAHLDTVPVLPTTRGIGIEGRRYYGRGACDTKASLAAMIVALHELSQTSERRPTVILAGVADEEYVMRGAATLLEALPDDVAGIVIGEPTSLLPVRAHNGFIRVAIGVHGVSAHSSRAELGVNAITQAARLVCELEDRLGVDLKCRPDPLTGHTLLNATMISGGIAPNVVPDYVEVVFDRRVGPGETVDEALGAIASVVEDLREKGVDGRMHEPFARLPGYQTEVTHPIVRAAVEASSTFHGRPVEASGVTYSTDACYLGASGKYPCVVLGPGSIEQAHTDEEWVDLDELVEAVAVYRDLVLALR